MIFSTEMALGIAILKEENTIKSVEEVKVGVVLDMESWAGKMGLSCISMALEDFYASHGYYNTRLVLHTSDSNCSVVGAATAGKFPFLSFF